MNGFDQLPKSVKKAIRYIKQDAPEDKLHQIKKIVEEAIDSRLNESNRVRQK